jgi:hypothetical protein
MAVDRTREFFTLVEAAGGAAPRPGPSPLSAVAAAAAAGGFGRPGVGTSGILGAGGAGAGAFGGAGGGGRFGAAGHPHQHTPSSFTRAAGEVSRDLQRTSRRIAELTQREYC